MILAAAVFVLILTIILGSYWLFVVRPEDRDEQAVLRRLKTGRSKPPSRELLNPRQRQSAVAILDAHLPRWGTLLGPVKEALERSGLRATIGAVLLSSVFVGMVMFVAAISVTSSWLTALVVGVAFASGPIVWVRRMATKRLARFEEQFPEAMDLMARSLRAGHALPTALQMVGEEIPDPVGGEFRLLFERQNYGMSLPEALREFAERVPLLDARFFVTALLTQRETGGNLSEILDNLASVIRERFKVKRQVRVISSQGRLTGWVLAGLPPSLAVILFIVSPTHMQLLVNDPLGFWMVVFAVILQVVGVLAIRRIVDVEY